MFYNSSRKRMKLQRELQLRQQRKNKNYFETKNSLYNNINNQGIKKYLVLQNTSYMKLAKKNICMCMCDHKIFK